MKFAMLLGLVEALTKRVLKIEQRPVVEPEALVEDVLARLPAPKDGVSPDPQAIAEDVLARLPAPPAPPTAAEIAAHVVVPELKLPSAADIAALVPVPKAPLAPTAKAVAALVPRAKDGERGPAGPPGPAPAHRWSGTKLQFKKPDGKWGEKVDLQGPAGKGGGGGGTYVAPPPSGGGVEIDDDVESLTKTWSSSKIRDELDAIPGGGPGAGVSSVNGRTGVVNLTKADVSLDKVQNLSPAEMPVSDVNVLKLGVDDIEIQDATKGIILRSPDSSRWRITIDNSGTLQRTKL